MNTTKSSKEPRLFQGHKDKKNFFLYIQTTLGVNVETLVRDYQVLAFKLIKNEGKLSTAKKLKDLYGLALRYSAKITFKPISFLRSDAENFPRVLKTHKKLLRGSPDEIRASLSVLQLFKLIDAKGQHSLLSITNPYLGNLNPEWLETFKETVNEVFPPEDLSSRIPKSGTLFISGKNGPNGPAMGTLHADYSALGDLLVDQIGKLAALTGNEPLTTLLNEIAKEFPEEVKNPKRTPAHSRLRVKHEPGGKARVFAILDYFSQSALSPLHTFLMKWLNSNKNDGTSNHSNAACAVREWTKSKRPIWSFDLTTATDRYPVFLQRIVIDAIFGPEIGELWETIITSRDFITPDDKETVRFAVGQPLGALSSWAAFSVTHHLHIMTAAKLAKCTLPFDDYKIIGDDISILGNAAVAKEYISMMDDIKVPFSIEKSILPEQCEIHPVAELAKRVFVNGVEYTPVPPDEVVSHMREPFGKRILIDTSINRGYSKLANPYSVQSIMSSDNDWACLTFPIGTTLPPVKAVKVVYSGWNYDIEEKPPGSLDPRWWYWDLRPFGPEDLNDDLFNELLIDFLVQQVDSAVREVSSARSKLYDLKWDGLPPKTQGGDWQPGLWELENSYDHVLTVICENYKEVIKIIRYGIKDNSDPFRIIARIHSIVSPEQMFGRKTNFLDDKTKTRAFVCRLVKLADQACKQGIYPIDTMQFGFRKLKSSLIL